MKKVKTDDKGRPYLRDWVCKCGCEYTAQVVLSDETTNLSGEATAWCPRCTKRPAVGSPAYRLIDGDRVEEGATFRARLRNLAADRNDPVYDRWLCWEQGDEVFFSVNDGRVPGKVGRLPRDEFDRLFERREFCGNTCPSGWQKRRSVAS